MSDSGDSYDSILGEGLPPVAGGDGSDDGSPIDLVSPGWADNPDGPVLTPDALSNLSDSGVMQSLGLGDPAQPIGSDLSIAGGFNPGLTFGDYSAGLQAANQAANGGGISDLVYRPVPGQPEPSPTPIGNAPLNGPLVMQPLAARQQDDMTDPAGAPAETDAAQTGADANTLDPDNMVIVTGSNGSPAPTTAAGQQQTRQATQSAENPPLSADDIDPEDMQVRQSSDPDAAGKVILNKIGAAESNNNSNAVGNAQGEKLQKHQDKDLSGGTVQQAIDWMEGPENAVQVTGANGASVSRHRPYGSLQILPETLKEKAKTLGVLDQPFTPEMQQKIGLEMLKEKGLQQYLDGGDSTSFTSGVAGRWETVPADAAGHTHTAVKNSQKLALANQMAKISPQEWKDTLDTARQVYQAGATPDSGSGSLLIPYSQGVR